VENQKELRFSQSLILSACGTLALAKGQGTSSWDFENVARNLEEISRGKSPPELTMSASMLSAWIALEMQKRVPPRLAWAAVEEVLRYELSIKPKRTPRNAFQFADEYGLLRGIILDVAVTSSLDLDRGALFRSASEEISDFVLSTGLNIFDGAKYALCLYSLALAGFLEMNPQLAEPENVYNIVQDVIEGEIAKLPILAQLLSRL